MKLVGLKDEDFINYCKACMYIGFPNCTFKCGNDYCQNSPLAKCKRIEISYESIVNRYMNNPYTDSIVFAGLEPMDDFDDVINLIKTFRIRTDDDIVIYTGFNKSEITDKIEAIKALGIKNIIIKFGRYIPNQESHLDPILGVRLASPNQYAERIV